jgi:hypothetical protein
VRYPELSGGREQDITELRALCGHIMNIAGNSEHGRLQPTGEAIVEYFGWDTHIDIQPWEVYEQLTKQNWGGYQVARITEDVHFLWDVYNGVDSYGIDDLTSPIYEEDLDEDSIKRQKQRIIELVGNPGDIHQEYRENKSQTDFEDQDEELVDQLRNLGYLE